MGCSDLGVFGRLVRRSPRRVSRPSLYLKEAEGGHGVVWACLVRDGGRRGESVGFRKIAGDI